MRNVLNAESAIQNLLDRDPNAKTALYHLLIRYDCDDNLQPTVHTSFIRAIYLERYDDLLWKLARDNNVAQSSLFRYRKKYIKLFYHYYEQILASAEAALSSD